VYFANGDSLVMAKALVGANGISQYASGSSSPSYGTISESRAFTVTTTGITFNHNRQVYTGVVQSTNNAYNKPKFIYGIK
jgi:hypothetical protein